MKKVVRITKTTKLLKVRDIVQDLESDLSDEEIREKHGLTWVQLAKVYASLYHRGYIDEEDLFRRVKMRGAKGAAHIPLVSLDEPIRVYHCIHCAFRSRAHFSTCPRCGGVSLRRLKRVAPAHLAAGQRSRDSSSTEPNVGQESPASPGNC